MISSNKAYFMDEESKTFITKEYVDQVVDFCIEKETDEIDI